MLRGALVIMIAVGLIGLVVDQIKLRRLQSEKSRLQRLVGKLDVDDDARIHIALVESPEPLHRVWRVYLPANSTWRLAHESAFGGSGWSQSGRSEARNELWRWRVVGSNESFRSHVLSGSGSSTSSIQPRMAEYLRSNWKQLDVQVAGADGTQVASADQIIPLVTIHVPTDLLPKVKEELGERTWEHLKEKPLLRMELGSEAAFKAREKQLREQKGKP